MTCLVILECGFSIFQSGGRAAWPRHCRGCFWRHLSSWGPGSSILSGTGWHLWSYLVPSFLLAMGTSRGRCSLAQPQLRLCM